MDFSGDKSLEHSLKGSTAVASFMEPISKKPDEIETEELRRNEAEELKQARPLSQTYTQKVKCDLTKIICTVTNEGHAVEKWIEEHINETTFGLDIEWKPNFVRGENNRVALLQISSETECLLVQLLHLDYIPESLRKFLREGTNSFSGVGITEDGMKLYRDHGLVCKGLVELNQYCKTRSMSLREVALLVLDVTVEKSKTITMSDWSQLHLEPEQVEYACMDAWLSYRVYAELKAYPDKRLAVKNFVKPPSYRNPHLRSKRRKFWCYE